MCGETRFEPLAKDEVKKLQDGDCISFLPNDLIFRVEIKGNNAITKESVTEESHKSKATDASDLKDSVLESNDKALDDKNLNTEDEGKNLETSKGFGEVGPSPGDEVDPSPGGEVGQSPGGKVDQSAGGDVDLLPGGNMGQYLGGEVGQSPGGEVGQSPGGEVGQSPGGEVGEVGKSPDGETLKKEDSPESSDDAEEPGKDFDEDNDKMEVKETAQPLNKKRVLPNWMTKGNNSLLL